MRALFGLNGGRLHELEEGLVGERGPGDNGQIVVDVSVPYDQAAELAARAATGKIALVLDSRER